MKKVEKRVDKHIIKIAYITSDTSIDCIDEDELFVVKRCLEIFGPKTKAVVEEKIDTD